MLEDDRESKATEAGERVPPTGLEEKPGVTKQVIKRILTTEALRRKRMRPGRIGGL